MIHLLITTEGKTELNFVNRILAPYLGALDIFVEARSVCTGRNREGVECRGGVVNYEHVKNDIRKWLLERRGMDCRFTTMFDFYRLPNNFPGFSDADNLSDAYAKVTTIENAMTQDIGDARFIPYIQLHEFEALILAEPQQLDWEYLEHDAAIASLVALAENQNPELINNGPTTAPSKRILNAIPQYDKATSGIVVVEQIGLAKLRERCTHFDSWVTQLEQLNAGNE